MLNEMGANIRGAGTPHIEVEGVAELHPVEHEVVGDRIEAGTFIVAGALMGGPVTVRGFEPEHLGLVLKKFEAMGISIERGDRCVTVRRDGPIRPCDIQTLPFPGFPTDMQAQTLLLLALADGGSIVTENVRESFHVRKRAHCMGADVAIEGTMPSRGVPQLSGAEVRSPDRAAAPRWWWPDSRRTATPRSPACTTSTVATGACGEAHEPG